MSRSPSVPYVATRSLTTVRSHWQYRDFHGRILGPEDDTFLIPPDALECDRLDVQHKMLELVLDSLYSAPDLVEKILAPREGPAPAVLDIGSGNGTWAVAMAQKFEHCEVVGIDLTPTPPKCPVPVNCRFVTDDANYPLEHYAGAFDVVHCRAMDGGITDYGNFLNECARALRPGGILLLVKGAHDLQAPDFSSLPLVEEGEVGFTALQKLFHETAKAIKTRGGYEDAALYWRYWLEHNPNYVKDTVFQRDLCVPVSAWQPDLSPRGQYICELVKHNILAVFRSFRALLLEEGFHEHDVDRWIDMGEQELNDKSVHAFARWRFAHAVRTDRPWIPAPSS